MTREEATKWMIVERSCIREVEGNDGGRLLIEAYDIAIEALSKPIVDISQRDLCADISCTDCPFMKETCKLMDCVAYADRPHGVWIKATGMMPPEFHGHHCCSECGNFANMKPPFGNREDLSNFCPNCGADMRKETE